MHATLEGGTLNNVLMQNVKLDGEAVTLAGALVLGKNDPTLQLLDPGGATRTVTLPAEADSKDKIFIIVNLADTTENLTVQNDTPATVATLVGSASGTANQAGIFHCDGTTWRTVLTSTRDVS